MVKSINVGMIGHKFMGKAYSNAYRTLPMFFPKSIYPNMNTFCERDRQSVAGAATYLNWKE